MAKRRPLAATARRALALLETALVKLVRLGVLTATASQAPLARLERTLEETLPRAP